MDDIVLIFQRKKIIDFVSDIVSMYLAELGKEGKLIELQLKEGMNFVNREISLMMKDYEECLNFDAILEDLEKLQYDDVLDKEVLFKIFLNRKKNDEQLVPKGYRTLRNIPILSEDNILQIVTDDILF